MSMIDIHAAAISSKVASYHEFLSRYSKTKKVVYGFVEGKEDPCFYRGFIESNIPPEWEVELWPAGNKDQVYKIHAGIDWRSFPKKRVCFFVDRDLSELIPENLFKDTNIYETDCYSVENDVVNAGTLRRVLMEVCGFGNVNHGEVDSVCDLFDVELEKFLLSMIEIMAWILYWRQSGKKANLNDIIMKDIYAIVDGCFQVQVNPKNKADAIEYIHSQCSVTFDAAVDVTPQVEQLKRENLYRKFTRGKYVLWFLIEFCCSVRRGAKKLFPSCAVIPPMHVALSSSNGMIIIGNRARVPASLQAFIDATFGSYTAEHAA